MRTKPLYRVFVVMFTLMIFLGACVPPPAPSVEPTKTIMATPAENTETPTLQASPTPEPTPTAAGAKLWVDPSLPEEIRQPVLTQTHFEAVENKDEADFQVKVNEGRTLSEWIFALAAPFNTIPDEVTSADLLAFWKQGKAFSAAGLVLEPSSYELLTELWGEPVGAVKALPAESLLTYCWEHKDTWAILPFGSIEPKWKVISVDGQNPLHKDFESGACPLTIRIGVETANGKELDESVYSALKDLVPASNRDAARLATVILTGVTALVRATAKEMELYGITRPGEVVGPVLREADITHISNEIPFAKNCPPPRWVQEEGLVFCSDDKYIQLLEEVGTDVVELTGDHFQDWGAEATLHTLDMYDEEGWPYYGGGRDINEAKAPLKLEVNGNKIAFLGCNAKAQGYATASETNPGAFHCDMDYMVQTVHALVNEGYLPIVTFQHVEFYRWEPVEDMIADFQQMAEAGAVIVSGSQAHQPHRMEFFGNAVLHYGLGNLFFDQMGWFPDSDKAFIDRHVFYDGKYLGVELLTVQFFDYSQPVWMTPEARTALLNQLFISSGWE